MLKKYKKLLLKDKKFIILSIVFFVLLIVNTIILFLNRQYAVNDNWVRFFNSWSMFMITFITILQALAIVLGVVISIKSFILKKSKKKIEHDTIKITAALLLIMFYMLVVWAVLILL